MGTDTTLPSAFRDGLVALLAVIACLACAPGALAANQVSPFRGSGAWIDVYDPQLLAQPQLVVDTLAREGVRTLYLETANYKQGARVDIVYPLATAALIDAAHARNLRVVAWYLPSLGKPRRDLRRSLAAIRFATSTGQRFDAFALDIEANLVRPLSVRNRVMLRLSRSIRRRVGPTYPLAAIVPDNRSTTLLNGLWPFFPYAAVARIYDVFLPMSYSSARGRGAGYVYRYTRDNIAFIRQQTGKFGVPVHVIGGLANRLSAAESGAFVAAARDEGAVGASFYDLRLSGPEDWAALRALGTP
jgi:hypothetical protein